MGLSGPPVPSSGRAGDGGFVLVVTLLLTAVLVAVFVELAYDIYISTARASSYAQAQRTSLLAGNGVELARSALKEILNARPFLTIDKEGLFFVKKEEDMVIEVRAYDELGKVSARIVYSKTGVQDDRVYPVYSRLLKTLKIEGQASLEHTLADWIDADSEPRIYGAEEADYYRRLPRPYKPRNGYPESLDELLLVKDYTPEVFEKIRPFVTVYSADGLVNVNTAPKEVLMALSDDITPELAQKIMDYRKEAPFNDRSAIMKVPGMEKIGFSLQDKITVRSDTFRVFSRARSGETVRDVEAVVKAGGGILYWREM